MEFTKTDVFETHLNVEPTGNNPVDTRLLEQIGETLITSKLLEAGILAAKPFFDHLGADLIGFTSIDDRGRFCRIQCKYRRLRRTASVVVDTSYVVGAFILFVCVQEDTDKRLYCFTPEEIAHVFKSSTTRSRSVFRLTITQNTTSALSNYDYLRNPQQRNAAIFHLIKVASPTSELQKIFSGLSFQMQKIAKLQKQREELQELIHQNEVLELEKNANDEQIAILKEYEEVLKQQQEQKSKE